MSRLLTRPPYAERDDALFLEEMNALTQHHLSGCPSYRKIWPEWTSASCTEELPFLHVGLFKHLCMQTVAEGIQHARTLHSSATSGTSSKIMLDKHSSSLQARSTEAILRDFLGEEKRVLLVVDSAKSLRSRGAMSARVAAAMSLKFLAAEILFLLDDAEQPASIRWQTLSEALAKYDQLVVYGFSWILWQAWGAQPFPDTIQHALQGKTIHFVHSGGWKKLESVQVTRDQFDQTLLDSLDPASRVVDYYGLVEQVGIIYPLCEHGYRHVPVWADVLVRDSYSLNSVSDQVGQLHLLNTLAWGAPYHNVLTEDLGRIVPGDCACGRLGKKFTLNGRIPEAEVRGCANV